MPDEEFVDQLADVIQRTIELTERRQQKRDHGRDYLDTDDEALLERCAFPPASRVSCAGQSRSSWDGTRLAVAVPRSPTPTRSGPGNPGMARSPHFFYGLAFAPFLLAGGATPNAFRSRGSTPVGRSFRFADVPGAWVRLSSFMRVSDRPADLLSRVRAQVRPSGSAVDQHAPDASDRR